VSAPFRLEALGTHDRTTFRCGDNALDNYFRTQVGQDIKRRVANCFVAVEAATDAVAAFYTLSAASVPLGELSAEFAKRLPRYPSVPAVRIGRLANDERFRGRGLGGAMLSDAAARTLQAAAAACVIVVDAKNDEAVRFYEHYGFQKLASLPMSLFLPTETARKALLGDPRRGLEARSGDPTFADDLESIQAELNAPQGDPRKR